MRALVVSPPSVLPRSLRVVPGVVPERRAEGPGVLTVPSRLTASERAVELVVQARRLPVLHRPPEVRRPLPPLHGVPAPRRLPAGAQVTQEGRLADGHRLRDVLPLDCPPHLERVVRALGQRRREAGPLLGREVRPEVRQGRELLAGQTAGPVDLAPELLHAAAERGFASGRRLLRRPLEDRVVRVPGTALVPRAAELRLVVAMEPLRQVVPRQHAVRRMRARGRSPQRAHVARVVALGRRFGSLGASSSGVSPSSAGP